jgi:hypothetical protein
MIDPMIYMEMFKNTKLRQRKEFNVFADLTQVTIAHLVSTVSYSKSVQFMAFNRIWGHVSHKDKLAGAQYVCGRTTRIRWLVLSGRCEGTQEEKG